MKTYLVIWLFIGGVDHGGPARRMPSIEVCRAAAQELLARPLPDNASHIIVGCAQRRDVETPA